MPDLSVTIAGVRLKNPVLPASGTFESLDTLPPAGDPAELGALVNKTITLRPRPGNPPPRIWETPAGMLNAVGIPSTGAADFISGKLPRLRAQNDRLIVSIAGFSREEFVALARLVEESGLADLLELNLSCPNLDCEKVWSTDRDLLTDVIRSVKRASTLPLVAKLSPNVADIGEMAAAAEGAGADALSLVNTFRGLAIDIRAKKPALGHTTGGLSGPAIKPLALYAVFSAYARVRIPIIGMGGICCWQDAVEFMLAGASAVAVGMYSFVNPRTMWEVRDGLEEYARAQHIERIESIIGLATRQGA
jgi:dihydroorotate dehydrogenase (NAD+) catalytic subunit